MLNYTNQIINNFAYVSQNEDRFALVIYNSAGGNLVFNLNGFTNLNDIFRAVTSASYLQSGSNLANGINTALSQVIYSGVLRPSAYKVAVIITNDLQSSQNTNDLQNAVQNLRNSVNVVYAIGINAANTIDNNVLNTVASTYANNNQPRISIFNSYGELGNNNAKYATTSQMCPIQGLIRLLLSLSN